VLLVTACSSLHRFTVEGRVLDETGRPWPSAQTEIRALNLNGHLEEDGRFRLTGKARAGCYAFRIFAIGGSEIVITFDPAKHSTLVIDDITVTAHAVETPALAIIGCSYPQDSLAVDGYSWGVDTIRLLR
jgi:hypothetical protein